MNVTRDLGGLIINFERRRSSWRRTNPIDFQRKDPPPLSGSGEDWAPHLVYHRRLGVLGDEPRRTGQGEEATAVLNGITLQRVTASRERSACDETVEVEWNKANW